MIWMYGIKGISRWGDGRARRCCTFDRKKHYSSPEIGGKDGAGYGDGCTTTSWNLYIFKLLKRQASSHRLLQLVRYDQSLLRHVVSFIPAMPSTLGTGNMTIDYRWGKWPCSGLRGSRDNFKPRFAFQQSNRGISWDKKLKIARIRMSSMSESDWWYLLHKERRAETLQSGLEFDNFKPRLTSSIFKYISWLIGSFHGGDFFVYWHILTRKILFCLPIYNLWAWSDILANFRCAREYIWYMEQYTTFKRRELQQTPKFCM